MGYELFKIFGTVDIRTAEAKEKIGELRRTAQQTAKELGKNFKNIGKAFSGIGTTFTNIGKTISTTVTAPIVALGAATAKTAIEFLSLKEQTRTAFKVLLGSAEEAEKMLKDLHVFAKTTPFSYQTYLQAGKTLIAMGVAAEDCIPYLDGITNAAIATGTGQQGIDRLSQAIGRMSSSGKVTLEMLNILTHSGIPAVKILANEYGVTTEQMFEMISSSEILAEKALPKLIRGMNEGTNGAAGMTAAYGGLAKEMKGTLAGAIDKFKSKFRDMSVEIWDAEKAYPHLIKAIEEFTGSLDVLPKIFESVSRAAVPVLQKITEQFKKLKKYLDTLDDKQLKKIGDIILSVAAAGPGLMAVGKVFKSIGSVFKNLGSIVETLGNAWANFLPHLASAAEACGGFGTLFGIIALAIMAVVSAIKVLIDNWNKVVQVFKNFANNVKLGEKFQDIKEKVQALTEKFKGLGSLLTVFGTYIIAILQPVFTAMVGWFNGAVKALAPLLDAIGGLIDILAGLGEFIISVFTGDWEKAWESIKKIGQGAINFIVGLWDSLVGWVTGVCEGVIGYIKALFDGLNIKDILTKMWTFIEKWSKKIAKLIGENFVEWGKAIVDWFEDLPTLIREKLEEWKKNIGNWFTEKKDTLVNGFKKWWQRTEEWFSQTPFARTFETIKTEVGKVFEDRDYLITLIEGWTSSLNEWSANKLQEICDEFESWKTTISNWFTEKKDTIVNGFTEWWSNVKTWFTDKKTEITNKFEEWKTAVSTWFTEKKDTIVKGFTEWWDNTVTWLTELPTKIVSKFEEWKTSISTWFTEKKDTLVTGFTEWWDNTVTWFTELPQKITTKFEEWKNAIVTWFTDKKDTLIDGFKEWLDGVKDWFTGENPKVQEVSEDIVQSVTEGVEQKTKDTNFILKLGQTILKFLLAAVAAVGVALLAVGWAIVDWILKGISKAWEELKKFVSKKVEELGIKISEKWEDIKKSTNTAWGNIKDTVSSKASELKEKAGDKIQNLVTSASKSWESLKSTASEKWNSIKSTVSEKADQIKQKAISAFQSIDSQSGGKLSSLVSKVSSKFGEIKDKIGDKLEAAKKKVSDVIEKIKNLFNFKWSLPKLKVPSFGISPRGWKVGDLLKGSIPHLSVEWHAKAMENGMILDKPTIFGMNPNGTLLGAGEAGSETVVGTNSLMGMIRNATNNNYVAELLEKILMYLQSAMPELANKQLVLDTGVLAGELTPSINARLGLIAEGQARGRS